MNEETRKLKMAVIAGAANAIKFKQENPRAFEGEVMQHISDNINDILKKIDEEL